MRHHLYTSSRKIMNNVSVSGSDHLGATHNGFPPCRKAVCMLLLSELRLKEEQLLAIEKFVTGSDVFVSPATGFGKPLIYGLLPAVFDRLKGYR